jgi:hypothetical protein
MQGTQGKVLCYVIESNINAVVPVEIDVVVPQSNQYSNSPKKLT